MTRDDKKLAIESNLYFKCLGPGVSAVTGMGCVGMGCVGVTILVFLVTLGAALRRRVSKGSIVTGMDRVGVAILVIGVTLGTRCIVGCRKMCVVAGMGRWPSS